VDCDNEVFLCARFRHPHCPAVSSPGTLNEYILGTDSNVYTHHDELTRCAYVFKPLLSYFAGAFPSKATSRIDMIYDMHEFFKVCGVRRMQVATKSRR
jgi:hypothetical protein